MFGAVAALLLASSTALAQTPDPKAEALNDDGKLKYRNNDFAGAADKFNEAIAISPDARYYFNLCATYEKLNDFDRALEACDAVYAHNPKDDLKAKTGQRAADIRQKKRDAAAAGGGGGTTTTGGGGGGTTTTTGGGGGGATTDGGGGGTTTTGGGGGTTTTGGGGGTTTTTGGGGGGTTTTTGGGGGSSPPPPYGYGTGAPPTTVEKEADPRGKYSWSLGGEIGAAFNRGVGSDGTFGKNGQAVHLHADFLVAPRWKVGVQAYLGITSFEPGDFDDQLNIVDFGGALFLHRRIGKLPIFVTPLVGAHLSGIQPDQSVENSYGTFGFRFEVGFQYVLSGGRHVISFVPLSINTYLPVAGQPAGNQEPSFYGLDKSGATWAFMIGYSYRFTKGFFPSVIVLE